ncbi:competence/damage-inducible protein A [Tindallia californiensis]|uniref:Putative competence-damage inducible protein n=1 Tax=Tindallia californiensis TaxID=159292 RepID=A0A1H3IDI4_9FIRM|nr:competence/damage-inducible protein A [Tindallia californiensis]SDY25800.1 competence/damage-inducible protein cinA [Tindallia californiensis]
MKAEIISIGTEILLGEILNTNAKYLSQRLAELGINVYYQTVVGDNAQRLLEAYKTAFSRADLLIVTGGLGPTGDDITKEVAATYFRKKMIFHENIWSTIQSRFVRREAGYSQNNKKQAAFPEGSHIINNSAGTAPGCWIELNGKIMIMMPGPPKEMEKMFENEVVKKLEPYLRQTIRSKTIRLCGIGESQVEEKLTNLMHDQQNPTIALYAKEGEVHIRITARATTERDTEKMLMPVYEKIVPILDEYIYGTGTISLEEKLFTLMRRHALTISIAESITGGLICAKLVNVSGMSLCLKEGVVAYSEASKIDELGVLPETIYTRGVVSEDTVIAMAKGIADKTRAHIGLATTGWADDHQKGSTGGEVWIGIVINGDVDAKKIIFNGDRNRIRFFTANAALVWLHQKLKAYANEKTRV